MTGSARGPTRVAYLHVDKPIRKDDIITVDIATGRVTVRRYGHVARIVRPLWRMVAR